MNENEILDEIHSGRAEHARRSGYDIHKMFREIREGTERLRSEGWKVVSFEKPPGTSYKLREEAPRKHGSTQRRKMHELYLLFRGNREQCVKAYAEAEKHGEVIRARNESNLSAEDYASKLFSDGVAKGWLD